MSKLQCIKRKISCQVNESYSSEDEFDEISGWANESELKEMHDWASEYAF